MQVEARGLRQVTPTHGAALSGTRGRRIKGALAAVVGGQREGAMELVILQWLRADIVRVESRTSSQGDRHNTEPPPLHAPGPFESHHLGFSGQKKLGKLHLH